ncbi:MAG: metalloregulator ArsR/SmtB family transcription factor [Caldisericia bacterium]|nr:metalloregulator ArsR/SmtB family transcription factor [Caldisericia bacterium]
MQHLLDFCKIMSDETRLRILWLLSKECLCVCQMCGILGCSQTKVSRHLSKLRDMQLVTMTRKDQFVYYSLLPDNEIMQCFVQYLSKNIQTYPQLEEDLQSLSKKCDYLKECKNCVDAVVSLER